MTYAVVVAPRVALLVYNASLNVSPLEEVKLCVATSNSCLNYVVIAELMAIFHSSFMMSAISA